MSTKGTIYLLHFERAHYHARHYLGWTTDFDARLAEHLAGRGARLMEVIVKEQRIAVHVARTWRGTRNDERRLKNHNHAPRLCPICNPGTQRGKL